MRKGSVSRGVGGLKLRAAPSMRGVVRDKLAPGASLEVGDRVGNWYAVRVVKTGRHGFVYAPDVEFPVDPAPAPPVDKPAVVSAPVAAPPAQPILPPAPDLPATHPVMPAPDHPTLFQGGVWDHPTLSRGGVSMAVAVFVIAIGWLLYWLTR